MLIGILAALLAAFGWCFRLFSLPHTRPLRLCGRRVGLAVHRRWPSATEVAGMAVLIVGVIAGIRADRLPSVPVPPDPSTK